MAKQSEAAQTLLAQFPTFRDWIVHNLTPAQIFQMREREHGAFSFKRDNPLNSDELSIQLWHVYEDCMEDWLGRYFMGIRFQYQTAEERLHDRPNIVRAIAHLMARIQPELLGLAVQRCRGEIEAATSSGQPQAGDPAAANRRPRL